MTVADKIAEQVRAQGLLTERRAVVVLLSGGQDSTCLLELSSRIAGPDLVTALHVNYGLRETAARDQDHCQALCARLGVRLELAAPPGPPPAAGNLQAWARAFRYARASECAGGIDIATGHTATDQVETILYRLASSPSRRALLGMRPRDGQLVRPLLSLTREQTAAYCQARGLNWCEDETNETDAYARNRVRHQLLPALREIHPGAERNVLMLAEVLRDEAAALDALVDDVLGGGVPEGDVPGGRSEISLSVLRGLPLGVARMVVQRLADEAVGGPAPGTARRVEEILGLRETGIAHLDLPHGVRATVVGGLLRFTSNTLGPQ